MVEMNKIKEGIKVLLIDDQEIFCRGLENLISDNWENAEVFMAMNLEEIKMALLKNPELIIVDVKLFKTQIFAIIEKLKLKRSGIKVLVYTNLDENIYAVPYLKLGVAGYISKSAREPEVLKAIHSVLIGEFCFNYKVKEYLFNEAISKIKYIKLSMRELEIAELLIRGVKLKEISEDLNLQLNTVNSCKFRMFKKLKINSLAQLADSVSISGDRNISNVL